MKTLYFPVLCPANLRDQHGRHNRSNLIEKKEGKTHNNSRNGVSSLVVGQRERNTQKGNKTTAIQTDSSTDHDHFHIPIVVRQSPLSHVSREAGGMFSESVLILQ
jgi:hypothetical protein